MDYETLVSDYKDMLYSLIKDLKEANELRDAGGQGVMDFTTNELRFIKELLEEKEDQIDGRC